MFVRFSAIGAVFLLAACQEQPYEYAPSPVTPTPYVTEQPIVGSGLEERQPDTCHAVDYISALGQPGSVIPTLGLSRPYRVVEWRGVEDQIYNPQRVVFRLDAAGNIFNIDCG